MRTNKLVQKLYLDGGISHALWMYRYNAKSKLLSILVNISQHVAASIEKQAKKRAIKELDTIKKHAEYGIYNDRATIDFLKGQCNDK